MPPSFDCVLTNGTVVNQDGDRRARHRRPRRAHRRDRRLERGRGGRARRLPGPSHPSRRHRFARCISASRGSSTRKISRPARGRPFSAASPPCSKCPTPIRRRPARRRSPTSSPARRAACTATSPSGSAARTTMSPTFPNSSGCPARRGSRCSWAPRPGACWSPTTRACWRSSKQTRRRAAFHSEDEARLNERKPLRVAGDPSSHPVWRDETAALRCTERLIRLGARGAGAGACPAYLDARGDGVPRPAPRTSRAARRRRIT